mmetsp:Transcript_95125/g.268746  ORF Transcript_95125/g.268746 Transcript_95125/m.268746 type:complete len:204 (+) Transcript_95125:1245-1856(+)
MAQWKVSSLKVCSGPTGFVALGLALTLATMAPGSPYASRYAATRVEPLPRWPFAATAATAQAVPALERTWPWSSRKLRSSMTLSWICNNRSFPMSFKRSAGSEFKASAISAGDMRAPWSQRASALLIKSASSSSTPYFIASMSCNTKKVAPMGDVSPGPTKSPELGDRSFSRDFGRINSGGGDNGAGPCNGTIISKPVRAQLA